MCAGSHLANRELYTAFVRLISAFHIVPAKNKEDLPILDCLGCNSIPTALTTEPKKFKCGFKARDIDTLKGWMAASDEATKDL
jgi:phenylacetate 2-hydroxylase